MKYTVFGVGLIIILTIFAYLEKPDNNLHIIACDVGQGDAFLLVYQDVQVLIDGGKPQSGVEECLDNHIPFWDRNLELVVITHPQLDHFGGVITLLHSHHVENILISGLENSTPEYEALINQIGVSQAQIIRPEDNPIVRYGLMHLDVVWPTSNYVREHSRMKVNVHDEDVLTNRTTDKDLNNFSVVLKLRLGEFDALFTGDIGPEVVESILSTDQLEDMEYIKVPHHGSKNGLTKKLLDVTNPELAVISVGKGNSFGHPHEQVLELLRDDEVKVFRTDVHGEIELVTDGTEYWVKN